MTRCNILTSSGHISHKRTIRKVLSKYDKYKKLLEDKLSPAEKDFIENIRQPEQAFYHATLCKFFEGPPTYADLDNSTKTSPLSTRFSSGFK